jgi:hypothetical protein
MVLAILRIKHQENLDDSGVIAALEENFYLHFLVELKAFSAKPNFDSSLFIEIHKRVEASTFDAVNKKRIQSIRKEKAKNNISTIKKGMFSHSTKGIFKWMLQLPTNR